MPTDGHCFYTQSIYNQCCCRVSLSVTYVLHDECRCCGPSPHESCSHRRGARSPHNAPFTRRRAAKSRRSTNTRVRVLRRRRTRRYIQMNTSRQTRAQCINLLPVPEGQRVPGERLHRGVSAFGSAPGRSRWIRFPVSSPSDRCVSRVDLEDPGLRSPDDATPTDADAPRLACV